MSELPSLVRVKRKRGADPTPDLFLEERSTKRSQTWQFRLQQLHPSENDAAVAANIQKQIEQAQADQANKEASEAVVKRREFRLAISQERLHNLNAKKRKTQISGQDIPTFVEATSVKKRRHSEQDAGVLESGAGNENVQPATTFKRPNANVKEKQWRAETWKRPVNGSVTKNDATPPDDRMVDALTRFALEEAERDEAREKPKVTSIPKKPVQRYKDRHPEEYAAQAAQAHAQNGTNGDVDMDVDMDGSDDDDYVYDTYVRTKDPVMLPTWDNDDSANDKIGYLVITEQDQPFWETYFEDEESDKEFDTDEEDENGKTRCSLDCPIKR